MTANFGPELNRRKCTGCALCVRHCPQYTLATVDNRTIISAPETCNYCGICQDLCPTGAINLVYEIILC